MRIGALRGDAAARRAGNEPLLQEVGLVDIANRVGLLADRGSQRIDSDRTAVELVDYRGEDRAVHLVEATRIDLEQFQRAQGHFARHYRRLIDLGEIPHPPQQTICNPWRAARARGQFDGTFIIDTDPEQMRRTLNDLCQVGARIKVQVIVLAETVAQRGTQESRGSRCPRSW
jgi:hypothetical protein